MVAERINKILTAEFWLSAFLTVNAAITTFNITQVIHALDSIHAIDNRLTRVEANEFTATDGVRLQERQKVLETKVAALETVLDTSLRVRVNINQPDSDSTLHQ